METPDPHSTILVVEDEVLIRQLSVDQLEMAGYEVLEAGTAAEAINILESGAHIAVMFTDVNMPGDLDGLQLARLVHDRWPNIQLLVTSGGGRIAPSDVPDDGCFIPKPYSLNQMRSLVAELVQRAA
jgi:CheY-like chemotaxis protein